MLRARRGNQQEASSALTPSQMVSMMRGILVEACAAEYAAVQWWSVPAGESGARWAPGQVQTVAQWEKRWRGLAQERDRRVVWFDHPEFDDYGAAELLAREKQRRRRGLVRN